jgi:chemotaxis protein CheD
MNGAVASGAQARAATAVVGLGALLATADLEAVLVTYALGSCLGVAVYDPAARVGGLLHAMMPRSELDPDRAGAQPALFVDTGIPALFRACYALGARKERLLVTLAGAASMHDDGEDRFQIGRRNLLMARQLFWKNGILVHAQDTGGGAWRTMSLHMNDGAVTVRSAGMDLQL